MERRDTLKHSLSDYLALERTILANERTLLSYLRTSLALLAAAITIFYLLPSRLDLLAGTILFFTGIFTAVCGALRFARVKARLDQSSRAGSAETAATEASAAKPEQGEGVPLRRPFTDASLPPKHQ